MVDELVEHLGFRNCAAALGMPGLTLHRWYRRDGVPSSAARRALWLVWCMVLHPDRIQSLEDLVTWGRLKTVRRMVERPACEWTDWSI